VASARLLKKIQQLREDHLNFKRPFVFKAVEFTEYCLRVTNQLGVELRAKNGFTEVQGFGVLTPDGAI